MDLESKTDLAEQRKREMSQRLTELTMYLLFFCVATPIVALVLRLARWILGVCQCG